MIVEAILDILINGLSYIIGFLPTFSIELDIASVLAQLAAWLGWANYYVPLEDFTACLSIVFSVWILCSTTSFILQVI